MAESTIEDEQPRGRRADAPPAKRDRVISVRVSEAEGRRIDRAAKRLGLKPSALMRAVTLDADEDGRIPSSMEPVSAPTAAVEVSPELKDLRVQIKGAAANINQLARIANTHRAVPLVDGEDPRSVSEVMIETLGLCREVLTALGAKGHR